MDIDLCARVEFQLRYVVRNGVGCTGWVSRHRTQVNANGNCQHLEARLALNRERGVMGPAFISEGKLCYGGFANVNGNVRGMVQGILRGHLVIMFSTTACDPVKIRYQAQAVCDRPPIEDPLCYDRPIDPGKDCIYCVDTSELPLPECTIEQNVHSYPCGALGQPSGGALLPYGFMIYPAPGMYDLTGDDTPFRANQGLTGKVKYYLQDAVSMGVDPLYVHPEAPNFCDICGAWLCNIIMSYLNPYVAWLMQCTSVLPATPDTVTGACCQFLDREHTIFETCDDRSQAECWTLGDYAKWRGAGSQCELVNCMSLPGCEGIDMRAPCCLPDGRCISVTKGACDAHGGLWFGGDVCRLADGSLVELPPQDCIALGGRPVGGLCGEQCVSVTCPHQDINLQVRQFALVFQRPIGFVQFGAGWSSLPPPCFPVVDNQCFSGGPDNLEACDGLPCWLHVTDSDASLRTLDSITLDCDMRLAETSQDAVNRYPHAEPQCVQISNAVLATVGTLLKGLTGRSRLHSYNRVGINKWYERMYWDCATDAPVICEVEVRPYKTPCSFPADLVLTEVRADLWLSGDNGHPAFTSPAEFGKVRVAAVLEVVAILAIRMREGWGEIDCPVGVINEPPNPCNPVLSDPERYMILASGGCSRVPRSVEWRGLVGPRPYSAVRAFDYESRSQTSLMCGDVLCGIDGLVVPGEVNDLADPDGVQRFSGDVVLLLDDNPANCASRGA